MERSLQQRRQLLVDVRGPERDHEDDRGPDPQQDPRRAAQRSVVDATRGGGVHPTSIITGRRVA